MNTTEHVLLIILSILAGVVLLLVIIGLIFILVLISNIRKVIKKAETFIEKAEHARLFFERTTPIVALSKLLGNIFETFKKKRNNHE